MTSKKYRRKRTGLRLCSYPGCRVIVDGGGRCRDHARGLESTEQQKASKKFLNSRAWLRCRALKLSKDPWCERCALTKEQPVPAVDIHHIQPRDTHPELALVIDNLMSLCKKCHGIVEKCSS
jgi:5-methylcytosine-specific restriction endonuclease McrA